MHENPRNNGAFDCIINIHSSLPFLISFGMGLPGVHKGDDLMRCGIYCRESSDDTNKAPSIESQIEAGKQWIKKEGHELAGIYCDNGYSGGDWRRPDWNRCIKDAKRHQFTLLWVWNQDRIARDTEQFLFFYRNMRNAHVCLYSQTEGRIDMEDLGGRVKHTTMAQASEIFRLVTSDKVKAKYRQKKEEERDSFKWGRPKKDIDIRLIRQLRNEGLGYRRIAEQIGTVSYQTIRRVLQNSPIS